MRRGIGTVSHMFDVSVTAVATLAGGLGGVLLTRFLTHIYERVQQTLRTFELYNSLPLIRARNRARSFLNQEYRAKPVAWSDLFSDQLHYDRSVYNSLVQVTSFWSQLAALDKQNLLENEVIDIRQKLIKRELAVDLLSYHWGHWYTALAPLAYLTEADDATPKPEWTRLILNGELDWLLPEGLRKTVVLGQAREAADGMGGDVVTAPA